jgi:hypothetical protein
MLQPYHSRQPARQCAGGLSRAAGVCTVLPSVGGPRCLRTPPVPLPGQTCGVCEEEVTVCEHDRDALLPGLVEVRRDSELRSSLLCWCGAGVHREGPGDPRFVHIFVPPMRRWLQHGDMLPLQCRLASELAPRLLSGGIGV